MASESLSLVRIFDFNGRIFDCEVNVEEKDDWENWTGKEIEDEWGNRELLSIHVNFMWPVNLILDGQLKENVTWYSLEKKKFC